MIAHENALCDEITIHFVDTEHISALHLRFFNDASPTDCMSFPIDSPNEKGYCVLGEVFVCPKTALEYAKEHNRDPYRETTLYLVHSLLHLLGYEDKGILEVDMRKAEDRHMKHLIQQNLLLKKPLPA